MVYIFVRHTHGRIMGLVRSLSNVQVQNGKSFTYHSKTYTLTLKIASMIHYINFQTQGHANRKKNIQAFTYANHSVVHHFHSIMSVAKLYMER